MVYTQILYNLYDIICIVYLIDIIIVITYLLNIVKCLKEYIHTYVYIIRVITLLTISVSTFVSWCH